MGIMSLTEIMDMSIGILRKYVKTIIMFTLGFGVVFFIALFIFILAAAIIIAITGAATSSPLFIGIAIGFSLLVIISFYLSSNIGLIKITCQEPFQGRIYASEAIKASFKSFFKVLGISIIALVIFLPVISIIGIIAYYLYPEINHIIINTNAHLAQKIFFIIISALIILVLLSVGFVYFSLISFSLHASAIERKGVIGSLKRSFELVKGNFWRILGSLFMIYLALYAIRSSLQSFVVLIAGIVYYCLKLLNISLEYTAYISKVSLYSSWPLNIIFYLFVNPLSTIMITLIYFNERFKTEGIDILLKLRRLKKNDERMQAIESTVPDNSN